MKKAVVFLADGFEEVEMTVPVDFLRRAGIEVTIAGVTGVVSTGARGIKVTADIMADDLEADQFDAFICPGGGDGAKNLQKSKVVKELIKEAYRQGRLIAAICAAPIVLHEAGVLEGKNFTIYPTMKDIPSSGKYIDEAVVIDGNIITASGVAAAPDFAFALIEYLIGKDGADKVASDTLFKR